jgi:hypothetical protein
MRETMAAMALLNGFLQNNRGEIAKLSIRQIVAVCGDGQLRDGSNCSVEFRDFLKSAPLELLAVYVQSCLESPFTESGSVLQDLTNELGRRLDFDVENGIYKGRVNAIGFDGLWKHESGSSLLLEVKTTDAYRINLDTIITYRDRLAKDSRMDPEAPCLIVVGREDTGDLEAQVRGSRHAWSVRIISADALLRLVQLKENADESTAAKTRELLRPFEYTRLDKIIDLAFTAASETTAGISEELGVATQEVIPTAQADLIAKSLRQQHTPGEELENLRLAISKSTEAELNTVMVKKSRAVYWSTDRQIRVVVSVSKRYPGGWYWYGYHPNWDSFLSEAKTGIFAVGCVGADHYFGLPYSFIHGVLEHLNTSIYDDEIGHWHIHLLEENGHTKIKLHKTGELVSIEGWKRPLLP